MYIVASDDVTTQVRKLKPTVSLQKAKMMVQNLRDTDYLGLEYWLEDDDGNEIEVGKSKKR
nr:MAG TPA: hypothetical protein [Caudoviricetes sp.]